MDEDTGEIKPEFSAAVAEAIRRENEEWDKMAHDYEEDSL